MNLKEAKKAAKHMAPTAQKFATHVVPQVVKPARALWNQIIGFVFICLSLVSIRPAVSNFQTISTDPGSLVRFIIALIFGSVMLFFGVSSFLRARRISRS
jgi:threonine/homoserine/homoserine lactone efflux protein